MTSSMATRISAAVVAAYALVLIGFTGPLMGWPGLGERASRLCDYVAIWTGGQLAVHGEPAAAYDYARHRAAQAELLGADPGGTMPWFYPPTFLLIASAMALLPFGVSMLVWVVGTYAAYAAAAARILGGWRGALWLTVPPAAILNAMVGNNGLLSAALFGFALALLPVRPVVAGVCFGLLTYKPHLGVLVPIALVVTGNWRATAAAAATALAFAAASVIAFGVEPWSAFLPAISDASQRTAAMASPQKLQSLFGMARALGSDAGPAYLAQMMLAAIAGLGVALIWRNDRLSYDIKAASLAAGSLLVTPYLFIYDLTILTLAQAFLYRATGARGLDRTEIAGLILANVCVLFFATTGVPLGLVATLVVAGLILRRAARELDMTANQFAASLSRGTALSRMARITGP